MVLQLIKFGIAGTIATFVDIGVLVILNELLHIDVLLASCVSFCTSVAVNYVLSMAFVFKSKKQNKLKEFIIFVLLSVGGLGLNQFILWIGESFTSVHYLIVKAIALVIVPVYNFTTRKLLLELKGK